MPTLRADRAMQALIDPDFIQQWQASTMPCLPSNLAREVGDGILSLSLADFDENGTRLKADFRAVSWIIVNRLVGNDTPHAPAHGTSHTAVVLECTDAGRRGLEQHFGIVLPEWLWCLVRLAAANHDCEHPGKPYFSQAKPANLPPHLSELQALGVTLDDCPVEFYSAIAADVMAASYKSLFNLRDRVLMAYLILATTVRPASDESRRLGTDIIRPQGFLGCLIAAADVAKSNSNFLNVDFEMTLLCLEREPAAPTSREEYIRGLAWFCDYREERCDALDEATQRLAAAFRKPTDLSLTEAIGWRQTLQENREHLKRLRAGYAPAWELVNAALVRYGCESI